MITRPQVHVRVSGGRRASCFKAALLAFVVGLTVSACSGDDPKANAEHEVELARYNERRAKIEAERKAEQDLMSNPTAAIPELERRVERHLSGEDGMLMMWTDQNSLVVYLRPSFLPGIIQCGSGGLSLSFPAASAAATIEDGQAEISTATVLELTRARLTPELCKAYAPAIGRKLLSLTKGQ